LSSIKIRVIKDTPFDLEGTMLSISDFRLKYSYICTKDLSDEKLISYLKSKPSYIMVFFELVEDVLDFIYEGFLYSKQMDGTFHKFHPGWPINKENSLDAIDIPTAEAIIRKARFKKEILYLSDKIETKL